MIPTKRAICTFTRTVLCSQCTMNGDYEVCQSDDKETMGLLKTRANFTNLLSVEEKTACCPGDRGLPMAVAEKSAARERFQANLERRAKWLMRRLCKLQVTQSAWHVSRELNEFVNLQRWAIEVPFRRDNIKSDDSVLKTSSLDWNCVDPKVSSPLTSILQRFSPLQHSNLLVKQRAAIVDYVKRCASNLPASDGAAPTMCSKELTTIPSKIDRDICSKLEYTCGSLLTNLSLLEHEVDSDATASSSGGESCDEMEGYDDRKSKATTIQRRAFWKWAVDRAAVVSRWTWLQAQVSDLEYRIRQTSEVHRQIRRMKDPALGNKGSVSASLANGLVSNDDDACCRTCPQKPIRKRKLLRTFGLSQISRKVSRLSTVRCGCLYPSMLCALCSGRANIMKPLQVEAMPVNERVALLDPSFHPILSFPRDISLAIHFDALIKNGEYNKLTGKQRGVVKKKARPLQMTDHARKQCRKLKKNATATLTAKLRRKMSTEKRFTQFQYEGSGNCRFKKQSKHSSMAFLENGRERNFSESSACSSKTVSPVPSPEVGDNSSSQASGNSSWGSSDIRDHRRGSVLQEMLRRRRGESAFDINNIVIPYSMAASTRVEILQYKEILTPKWRVVENVTSSPENCVMDEDDDDDDVQEDVTEETVTKRHERCEINEKKRFMSFMKAQGSTSRRVRSMRSDSRADSSGANTPDPQSPHAVEHHDSPLTTPPSTPAPVSNVCEDQLPQPPLGVHQRRRTTSLSRRDRMQEDFRVSTPPEVLYEYVPVPPWEQRTFPLCDLVYEDMVRESASSVNDVLPSSCEVQDSNANDQRGVTGNEFATLGEQCDISDWPVVAESTDLHPDGSHTG